MDRHIELGYELAAVTGLSASNVHWQPGPSTSLKYPCIVYEPEKPNLINADNRTYIINDCYSITYIYKDRKSSKHKEILENFSMISSNGVGVIADGLYHDYFTLYY